MVRSAALFALVTAAFATDEEVAMLQTKLSQVDKHEQTYNPPPVDYGPEAVVVTPAPPKIGTCIVSGDPHIKSFDRPSTNLHFFDYGDYYIVKSSGIWIQGRYFSPSRKDGNAILSEFAMSEPGGGNKIIVQPKEFEQFEPAGGTFGGLVRAKTEHSRKGWEHGSKEIFDFKDLNVVLEVFRFNGHINVVIRAPQEAGMSGHCGNFNDDPNDDTPSKDMVPTGEVLFAAKEWTFTHPAHKNCGATLKKRAMGHCSQCAKHLGLKKNLEVDMEDCVIDYCSQGQGSSCDVMAAEIEAAKLAAQYR